MLRFWIQQRDAGAGRQVEGGFGGSGLHIAVAEKNVAAEFIVVVAGRFSVWRKNILPGGFRQRVHLLVGHQRAARAVAQFSSHVKRVADFSVGERLRIRQWFVFASGTNEKFRAGGVFGNERTERRFGRLRAGQGGERVVVVQGVRFERGVNVLEIFLALADFSFLKIFRAGTEIKREEDDDDRDDEEQFEQ